MNKNENLIKQIAVLKMRSKETIKTFSSVNRMFSIKEDKDDKDLPYDFVSSPSRINFAIIEKTEQGSKVCDVNLTKEEINEFYKERKKHLEEETKRLQTLAQPQETSEVEE